MGQVDDNIERFMASCDRAKKIIQMDANGELNKYKSKNPNLNEDISNFSQPIHARPQTQEITQQNIVKSKLPREILESFQNKQINVNNIHGSFEGSILDEINKKTQGQFLKEEKSITQPITEIKQTIPSNVDYSMIKMIVEDCVKKYTNALKKSIINESKNIQQDEIQAVKLGDKFSFITKNGDLYEAKLTFIKNINKKG